MFFAKKRKIKLHRKLNIKKKKRSDLQFFALHIVEDSEKEFEKGHSRNSSFTSQHSRNGSNYGSLTHSRQSSTGTGNTPEAFQTHTR